MLFKSKYISQKRISDVKLEEYYLRLITTMVYGQLAVVRIYSINSLYVTYLF